MFGLPLAIPPCDNCLALPLLALRRTCSCAEAAGRAGEAKWGGYSLDPSPAPLQWLGEGGKPNDSLLLQ